MYAVLTEGVSGKSPLTVGITFWRLASFCRNLHKSRREESNVKEAYFPFSTASLNHTAAA